MNISRCKRRFRTNEDIGIVSKGGLNDLFDNQFKSAFRINDDEYDYLAENLTDEDSYYFIEEPLTFGECRILIKLLESYLTDYYKTLN
jgi:hypothetical protein